MDLYKILNIQKDANQDVIKRAYRNLSKLHHPDIGGDEAKFIQINFAYKVLSDPKKRKQYDIDGYITPDESIILQNIRAKIALIIDLWAKTVLEQGNNVSVIRFFNAQIKGGRGDMSQKLDQVKRSLRFIETSSKQLVYKDDKESMMHIMIQHKITQANAIKRQIQDELTIIEGVASELEKYVYNEPNEIENATTSTFTAYTTF